jgi:hypothetical protein
MSQQLNYIVAKTSPNIYAAAKQANLKPDQITQIEQYSWTVDKNKSLSRLKVDDARKEFTTLDTDVQEMIKFLYPNAEYTKEAPDAIDNTLKVGKIALTGLASPLIYGFKALGAWNRIINTPYLVARQVAQGEGLFNKETFTDAWDGRRVYDNGALATAIQTYGSAKVEVAKGLLAGKTPGEIIKAYGQVDDDLLSAIQEAYNEEEKFKTVLDDVKYSQVSPGRDIARSIFGTKEGDVDWRTRKTSATIDFIYQIAIDPLSWATGGTSKLATLASKAPLYGRFVRAAQKTNGDYMIDSIRKNGGYGVEETFNKFPDIRKHWDEEIGPAIKKHIETKGDYSKGESYRAIAEQFPGHANRSWVSLLARNGVVDAESAIQYFGRDVDAAKKLMSGRVDGMQYYRNGIPTSRNQRQIGSRFGAKVNEFLNPKYKEEEGDAAWAALTKVGPEDANYVSPEVKELETFYKGISLKEKAARGMSRTPQNRSIRIGDNAIETADAFYDTVRMVLPADLSDMVTHRFVNSTADVQVQVLRSVYTAIMQKAGLEGHPNGKKLIDATLKSKFGDIEGMSIVTQLDIPAHLSGKVKGAGLKVLDGIEHYETNGLIHPFQETNAIGNLDYQLIAQTAYEVKSKKNIVMAVQGASQQKFASEFVNFWSVLTLFPRLGMRSAIDEGVMFMLTAPAKDIFDVLRGKGARMGKVATATTGSKNTEGFKAILRSKLEMDNISESIDVPTRIAIRQRIAENKGISEEQVRNVELALATAHRANMLFPSNKINKLDNEELDYFMQAVSLQGNVLAGSAASIASSASLSSRNATEIAEQLIPLSKYDLLLKEIDIVSGRKGTVVDTRQIQKSQALGEHPLGVVHFENWGKRFYGNSRKLKTSTDENRFYNPVSVFFDNNALRTEKDFEIAVNTLLQQVGIGRNKPLANVVGKETMDLLDGQLNYVVDDADALADFLTMSSLRTTQLRQSGISDIDIARDQITRGLLDMYTTFHGKSTKFNDKLFRLIRTRYKEMGDGASYGKAAQSVDFEDFVELTKGMQPDGKMFTMLDIDGIGDTESAIKLLGNNFMQIMDNQVTGLLRQPVVMISYLRIRKNLAGLEKQHYDDLLSAQIREFKEEGIRLDGIKYYKKDSTPVTYLDDAKENINEVVNKKFTELAIQDAADTVLKFADNPNIRSNFALSARNVGRFYRATEDFWRRMYRMKDVKLRAAYRMRLVHVGMDASGDVYEDADGQPYVMMPMDDIIFKTVDSVVRTFDPEANSFKQPLFNDFTFKLSLANPSFTPDAGLPTLSGPVGALSILTMKKILGQTGSTGKRIGEELDNYALGSIGDNITFVRAVVPASLQKIYAMLPVNEKSRQEATAAMQAIAFNAAAGNAPGPDSTPEERYKYLKNIRISAHNVMVMRSVLGLVSPFTATTQESKDVPDYLLNVGITGLRPEFYDLVNGITQRYGGDVQNPYDLAVATFVGQNPNKIIYTVSRDNKETNVVINKTKEMKNWYIDNKNLVDTYGESAFIFAPHTGDFDASSYSWLEAAGYIKNKDIEQYYMDVMVSRDKQAYFNIARDEKEALSKTSSITARKSIISASTAQRASLKLANPFLEAAITGGGNEIATEQNMFVNIEAILKNVDIPMDAGTRSKLLILSNQIRGFINMSTDPQMRDTINFSALKRERKESIQALINEFIEGDLVIKEANRAVFQAILGYYSRETYSAITKGY